MAARKTAELSLTERRLMAEAGPVVFERGEDYVRYVHGLVVTGASARASIQGQRVYQVEMRWAAKSIDAYCSCPHFDQGFFCKHLVALGLAVIDAAGGRTPPQVEESATENPIHAYLASLDVEALRDLVLELVARDEEAEKYLAVRAASVSGDPTAAAARLVEATQAALATRGFIDYRRSFDVAAGAELLLTELQEHLDNGAAAVVQPALLKAVTRLRAITLNADDSSGMLGSACQRAADLYARACRESPPSDSAKLARWLLKFRMDSPGWPALDLADFAPALDDRALSIYRSGVAKAATPVELGSWDAREIHLMQLELADHDHDVDEAVRILAAREHPVYGGIVERLTAAGRVEDAMSWVDRAVEAGRVSGFASSTRKDDYWLAPGWVAGRYLEVGRTDDALSVLRREFARQPTPSSWRELLELATAVGDVERERADALQLLEKRAGMPYGNGAELIDLALSEQDLEAAWQAAETYGPGHAWERLAKVSVKTRPREAAELYLAEAEGKLPQADTRVYPEIAKLIATARDLYASDGDTARVAAYVAEVRATYPRRSSLMAALDKQRL